MKIMIRALSHKLRKKMRCKTCKCHVNPQKKLRKKFNNNYKILTGTSNMSKKMTNYLL